MRQMPPMITPPVFTADLAVPAKADPLAYAVGGAVSWLPIYRGVIWGAVCYLGLSILHYVAEFTHYFAMLSGWDVLFTVEKQMIWARFAGESAKLILIIAAIVSLGMREGARRFLLFSAIATLVLGLLSDLAANLILLSHFNSNSPLDDIKTYLVQQAVTAATAALIQLLLVMFLRRREVQALFRREWE